MLSVSWMKCCIISWNFCFMKSKPILGRKVLIASKRNWIQSSLGNKENLFLYRDNENNKNQGQSVLFSMQTVWEPHLLSFLPLKGWFLYLVPRFTIPEKNRDQFLIPIHLAPSQLWPEWIVYLFLLEKLEKKEECPSYEGKGKDEGKEVILVRQKLITCNKNN